MVLWREQEDWRQIKPFFLASCENMTGLHQLQRLTRKIARCMASLDNPMQDLCRETCPGCDDNCCIRATIYYDFKDLLFLYLYSGRLPQMQIIKQKSCSCPNLASQGCILPRQKRPFVCTWYICPRQKAEIYQAGETSKLVEIEKTIKLIQAARNTLEDTFVENALKKISNHP